MMYAVVVCTSSSESIGFPSVEGLFYEYKDARELYNKIRPHANNVEGFCEIEGFGEFKVYEDQNLYIMNGIHGNDYHVVYSICEVEVGFKDYYD